jgi:hypothetical protein
MELLGSVETLGNKIVEPAPPGPEDTLAAIIFIHPTIWARRLHGLRYPEA